MGSLGRRLDRLEARLVENPASAAEAEEHEKQRWLARARLDRNEEMPPDVRHARSLLSLYQVQGMLSEMGAQELVDRIVSWRPVPEGGRSRATVEREVALAIYGQEPGTEDMVCPAAWRESFAAGDELRERYSRVPDGTLARGDFDSESFGITDELLERAIGPDAGEFSEEEGLWRLREYLCDVFYGERGYAIARRARLEAGREGP